MATYSLIFKDIANRMSKQSYDTFKDALNAYGEKLRSFSYLNIRPVSRVCARLYSGREYLGSLYVKKIEGVAEKRTEKDVMDEELILERSW